MKSTVVRLASLLALACLLLQAGCASVRTTSVPNTPGSGAVEMKGMPAATIAHFDEVYPPVGWPDASRKRSLFVGPVLVSREALLLMTDKTSQTVSVSASAGNSTAMVEVSNGPGEPKLLTAEHFNDEVRAVLQEALVSNGAFKVVDALAAQSVPADRERLMESLKRGGVNYLLDGNLAISEADPKVARLYVRIVDLVTREVRCATAAEGVDVREVAGKTAAQLLSRFKMQE